MKFLMLGDQLVGKTSILYRFADNVFNESHIPTVGIDYRFKSIKLQDQEVRLQIWEISGRHKFLDMITGHFHGAAGLIFVYDITNEESFLNVQDWARFVKDLVDPNIPRILVGNKCDIDHQREVSTMQGEAIAKQNNSLFMEVSAKSGENIEMMFMSLAKGKTMPVADDKDPLPPYTWGETTTDRGKSLNSANHFRYWLEKIHFSSRFAFRET